MLLVILLRDYIRYWKSIQWIP